jgi:hypothetical protein
MSRIIRLLWMHSGNSAGNNLAVFIRDTGRLSMDAANGGLINYGVCSLTC